MTTHLHPNSRYIGRFAPSPTGALHAGSLVTALASWLDARAHDGQWLIRIEDVDQPRSVPGMSEHIVGQLAACGLTSDGAILYQSQRTAHYEAALHQLGAQGAVYRCACSRAQIAQWQSAQPVQTPHPTVYPGWCRPPRPEVIDTQEASIGSNWTGQTQVNNPQASGTSTQAQTSTQYAYRLRTSNETIHWVDRRLGAQAQNVNREIGDFVVKRADRFFAYQLAVVVDDADQGITHIVRGEDLMDNTARQIALQAQLGYPHPQYLHMPLVLGQDGRKLSKQNGAKPLSLDTPALALDALRDAACILGLEQGNDSIAGSLRRWTQAWRQNLQTRQNELSKDDSFFCLDSTTAL